MIYISSTMNTKKTIYPDVEIKLLTLNWMIYIVGTSFVSS